jgi:hypothetical protein
VNPWVHVSRLKPRVVHPRRPTNQIDVDDDDDFDAALLSEDSWEADNANDEYEVEKILDLRWSKRTRTSRRVREYLVKWKGYSEPDWVPASQLSCGALLYEYNQGGSVPRNPGWRLPSDSFVISDGESRTEQIVDNVKSLDIECDLVKTGSTSELRRLK